MSIFQTIAENIRNGDPVAVEKLVREAISQGANWEDISEKGLFQGMEVVGKLFREDDMFVPEVLMSAQAMQAGFKVLEPLMAKTGGRRKIGKVILGTVKGDIHDLGKNLVSIMLRGAGFEVIDIGIDVPTEKFISTAVSENAQIIAMSALLTFTMPNMKTVIDALDKAGLKGKIKTVIGGACITQQYAEEIGADAFGANAGEAVIKVRELLGIV